MSSSNKILRICPNGHRYYKSSDCPVCPICEQEGSQKSGVFGILGAPARRALENEGIKSALQLSKYRETEILQLHGMGPSSLPKLREILASKGLTFKKKSNNGKSNKKRSGK